MRAGRTLVYPRRTFATIVRCIALPFPIFPLLNPPEGSRRPCPSTSAPPVFALFVPLPLSPPSLGLIVTPHLLPPHSGAWFCFTMRTRLLVSGYLRIERRLPPNGVSPGRLILPMCLSPALPLDPALDPLRAKNVERGRRMKKKRARAPPTRACRWTIDPR